MTRKRDSLAKLIMLIISNELDYVPVPDSVAIGHNPWTY